MSQRCLAVAVRNKIRDALELNDSPLVCEVMFDGMPQPMAGEWFYAVHPGEWTGTSEDADLQEQIGIYVTVTRRLGGVPQDRWGPEVWAKALDGLDVNLRKIVRAIHRSYDVLNAANQLILDSDNGVTQWGFVEPLSFLNGGNPTARMQEWFSAEQLTTGGKFANAGVSQTLTFGKAKRCQPTEEMG